MDNNINPQKIMGIKKPGFYAELGRSPCAPHTIINAETAVLVPAYLMFPDHY